MSRFAVAVLLALPACGGERFIVHVDPCLHVICANANEFVRCDPIDAICKCGPPQGNLVCREDEACTPVGEDIFACVQLCPGPGCPPVTPVDRCVGVACAARGACDPTDGVCRCGGAVCVGSEACEDGACTIDPCYGVNCPGGLTCNRADATCHCGEEGGPVCLAGEACLQGACITNMVCEKVSCPRGSYCDPNPEPGQGGFCRCGGFGAEYPRCHEEQTCDPQRLRCVGELCYDVDCSKLVPGSSCDPEDGKCKCGGLDGTACADQGLACAVQHDQNVCTTLCSPLAEDCTGDLRACYFDFASKVSLCLERGDTDPGGPCKVSSDCVPGSFCVPVNNQDQHVCRILCDLSAYDRGEPTGCPDTMQCSQLVGAPTPVGQCLSFNRGPP